MSQNNNDYFNQAMNGAFGGGYIGDQRIARQQEMDMQRWMSQQFAQQSAQTGYAPQPAYLNTKLLLIRKG